MADVTVANTSGGLAGKTLTCHEVDGITTGLWTLNRGASPPFAVVTGAAAVSNLDADKVDGYHAADFAVVPITGAMIGAGAITVDKLTLPARVDLVDGANVNIDVITKAAYYRLVAAGDRTLTTPQNPVDGQKIIIQHVASGGARTLTLQTGFAYAFRFGSDITGLTATASGKTDYIGAVFNLTDQRWDVVAVTKGF
jgi:hypothetical protein